MGDFQAEYERRLAVLVGALPGATNVAAWIEMKDREWSNDRPIIIVKATWRNPDSVDFNAGSKTWDDFNQLFRDLDVLPGEENK